MKPLTVALGTDHAGRSLRAVVADAITDCGHEVALVGPQSGDAVDYPVVARAVADALRTGCAQLGILICGSGAGVTVAANKIPSIRAALAHEPYTARQMVEHDHVNVLAMGARVLGPELAADVTRAFLRARFSGVERHARRLSQVLAIERQDLMNAPKELHDTGQSLWLDNITRKLVTSGTLAHYINDFFVSGVTSNPTILEKAISSSADYDSAIARAVDTGTRAPEELVFSLALDDLVAAADLLRPIHDASGGTDGFVSIEVSPDLADDAAGTVVAGKELFVRADRPNMLIKVPGTPAGLVAIEELIAAGVPVNVTLLFSSEHYTAAADAYLRGIERRREAGQDLAVASVASVFVSRWDAAADPHLPGDLVGKTALAVMQQTFACYTELLASERWRMLAASGAVPQKVLWASTGTKNPELPDTYYLGRLAAAGTVDTIPEPTLLAFADHGVVCELLTPDLEEALAVLAAVAEAGVDLSELAETLQRDGAKAFQESWAALLACVDHKIDELDAA